MLSSGESIFSFNPGVIGCASLKGEGSGDFCKDRAISRERTFSSQAGSSRHEKFRQNEF